MGLSTFRQGGDSKGKRRTRPALARSAAAATEAAIATAAAVAAAATAVAAAAAAAAETASLRLRGAASHLLSALLAFALVVSLYVVNLGALDQALPVLDPRKVAEEVLTTIVGLNEAKALLVPAEGDARLPALTPATAATPATAVTPITATARGATAAAAIAATCGRKFASVSHDLRQPRGSRPVKCSGFLPLPLA